MAQEQSYGGFWVRLIALLLDNTVVFLLLLAASISMTVVAAVTGMETVVDALAWLVFTFVPFLY